MATLTPLTVGNAAAPNGWVSAPNGNLGDNSDATFGYDDTNTTGAYDQGWALNNVDSDFDTMDTLSVVLRYARDANNANKTWDSLQVRVMDGATVLAAADSGGTFATVASSITTTTPTDSSAYAFGTSGYLNTTATKTQWDAAVVEIRINTNRSKGGNSDAFRVYEADFTGTYTAASGDATITPTAVAGATTIPTQTITSAASVTATAVVGATTVDPPTVTATATVTPTAVVAATTIDAPTVTHTATVTPTAVTGVATVDTPLVDTSTIIIATAVQGVATVPVPTVTHSAAASPTAVAGTTTVDAPTVVGESNATVTPTAVTGVTTVDAPTVTHTATVTPTAVVGTATVDAPTITSGATISPTAVVGQAAVDAPTIDTSTATTVTPTCVVGYVWIGPPGWATGIRQDSGGGVDGQSGGTVVSAQSKALTSSGVNG